MMEKKLVYILGDQRSGTTALEYILSTSSDTHALGEVMLLQGFIRDEKKFKISKGRCTCGEKITDCTYWKPIIEKLCIKFSIDKSEIKTSLLENSSCDEDFKKHLRELYESAYASSSKVLIDSSKDLSYLNLLKEILFDWEISVIRISRDPIEVVSSILKWRQKFGHSRIGAYYFLAQWAKANRSIKKWVNANPNVIETTYEDFVSSHKDLIPYILRSVKCDSNYANELSLRQLHTVAGTPTRFEQDTFVLSNSPIRNDSRRFPVGFKCVANFLAKRYR